MTNLWNFSKLTFILQKLFCRKFAFCNFLYKAYVDTYIDRDVRNLISVQNEMTFRNFLSFVALRNAQQINYEDISRNVGITSETCRNWFLILLSSGIVYFLEPFLSNLSKRITKSPKMYFTDTGLCAYLCRWQDWQMLSQGVMNGAFFENYVVVEIIKNLLNHNINPKEHLFYYRDVDKREIDVIYVDGGIIYPIEIKAGVNPSSPDRNFNVMKKYNLHLGNGLVIENTDGVRRISENAYTYPVSMLGF